VGIFDRLLGRDPGGGTAQAPAEIQVGGVYSVVRGLRAFGVAKVLAFEPDTGVVCVRLYSALDHRRVAAGELQGASSEPEALTGAFGRDIGAAQVTQRVFAFWQPQFVCSSRVDSEEEDDVRACSGAAAPEDELRYL
jgi:hypothetical protein